MTITTDLGTDLSRGDVNKKPTNTKSAAAAVVTGGGLAAFGLSRRSLAGLGLAAGGAYLAYHGITRIGPYIGKVRISYTVNCTPEELYNLIRDPQTWREFSQGVEINRKEDGELALILGQGLGFKLNSGIRVTEEQPGSYIAWSSNPGALEHRGVVHFKPAPGDRGTELSVALEYKIPAGTFTQALGMLYGQGPEPLVRENLRRLKQFAEAGEIPTTTGQPTGARGIRGSALRVLYRENKAQPPQQQTRMAGD